MSEYRRQGAAFEILRSVAAERLNVRSGVVAYLAELNDQTFEQALEYLQTWIDTGFIAAPIGRLERTARLEVTPAGLDWLGPEHSTPYELMPAISRQQLIAASVQAAKVSSRRSGEARDGNMANPVQYQLLAAMATCSDGDGGLTKQALAKMTGLSVDVVAGRLSTFRKHGWVLQQSLAGRSRDGRSRGYSLSPKGRRLYLDDSRTKVSV